MSFYFYCILNCKTERKVLNIKHFSWQIIIGIHYSIALYNTLLSFVVLKIFRFNWMSLFVRYFGSISRFKWFVQLCGLSKIIQFSKRKAYFMKNFIELYTKYFSCHKTVASRVLGLSPSRTLYYPIFASKASFYADV